ncbi:MAG: OmpA family protein [Rhodospirillales bacterium]
MATLQFGRGSAALAREEYVILRAVAALRARKGGTVQVVGHADSRAIHDGAPHHVNELMARRRSAAVADTLAALGLPRGAISAESRGDREPRYDEAMSGGVAGNRRVEIFLLQERPAPDAAASSTTPGRSPHDESSPAMSTVSDQPSTPPAQRAEEEAIASERAPDPKEMELPAVEVAHAGGSVSQRVRIGTLYFPHGSSRMGKRERAIIQATALFQRQHQGNVVIVGHASTAGVSGDEEARERANRSVSLARADKVARALAATGIAATDMSVVGRGADEPAFAEADAASEAANRRVEIYIDLPATVRLADRQQGLPR